MPPVVYTDDDSRMDQKELFFEASVLHRIPSELLVQSSSSTPYCQSFPNGKIFRTWLSARRKDRREERLRRLAKFHAELMGKSIEDDGSSSTNVKRITNDPSPDNDSDDARSGELDRNELLLDITLRTMVLLHHNQQLQNKLTALQMETRNFVRSCHTQKTDNNDRNPLEN